MRLARAGVAKARPRAMSSARMKRRRGSIGIMIPGPMIDYEYEKGVEGSALERIGFDARLFALGLFLDVLLDPRLPALAGGGVAAGEGDGTDLGVGELLLLGR